MTAPVVPLRGAGDVPATAAGALAAVSRHLDRCKLSARTVRAYKRQAAAYTGWLAANADAHRDAFDDLVGAEGAVTAWKRDMLAARAGASTVNQALAAVTLMYEQAGVRIAVKRVRVPRPGEPDALTRPQEAALRRAAARATQRSSGCCSTPAPGSRNAPAWPPMTSRSPPAPARSACTARATRSAPSRCPAPHANWSPRGSTCAAATPGRSGPGSAARSPTRASPRSCSRPERTPESPGCARTAAGIPAPRASARAGPTRPRSRPYSGGSIDTSAQYFRAGPAENAAVIERVFGG